MVKSFVCRRISWMLLASLLVLVFALSACGGSDSSSAPTPTPKPVTVQVNETHAASGDVYTCDPTSITVKKGDTVTFTNNSDENQDFDLGDTQKAGVDFVIAVGAAKSVIFNNTGNFTIKSEKGASITVTVN